jgi:hypothetical protein
MLVRAGVATEAELQHAHPWQPETFRRARTVGVIIPNLRNDRQLPTPHALPEEGGSWAFDPTAIDRRIFGGWHSQ